MSKRIAAEGARQDLPDLTGSEIGLDIRDALDALPFYVLLVDADHNILEANEAVKSYLGMKREDILGKYCPKIIHGMDQPFQGCPLEDAAEKNIAIERELRDEKTGHWVNSAVYPTRAFSKAGKRIFLHMVTDITEKKRAQEQLRISRNQLRSLSAHLESVREEEKRKIARDLHDETSQVLASLHAHLEAAIETLPGDAEQTREILRKAQKLSTTIHDEIHELIYELRPSMLDGLGLVPAVSSLVDNHLKAAGLKVTFKVTGVERRLPPALETALFRVVQETFNNIVRHAQARKVTARVDFRKDSFQIRIKDDGSGFDVAQAMSSTDKMRGMGLVGMRERVELVQGTINVKSSPDHGTEVTVVVPLGEETGNG